MGKRSNDIIYFLILCIIFSCSTLHKKEEKYIFKNFYMHNINCDIINELFNENNNISQENVLKEMGVKYDMIKDPSKKYNHMSLHVNDKTYILNQININNKNVRWFIYYSNISDPIMIVEMKHEDPYGRIFVINDKKFKDLICALIEDKEFILNKLNYTEPAQFTPPDE